MKILIYLLFLAAAPLHASDNKLITLNIEVVIMKGKTINEFGKGQVCEIIDESEDRYLVIANGVNFWVDKRDTRK